MARLSVVMPVFNGARTLARTLDSLAAQDALGALEIVAVDQASTDGSAEMLEAAHSRLPLILRSAPDSRNWMRNVNIGLAIASAPYVSILHQDDLWSPGRAAAMLALAGRHRDAALWLHPAWFIDADDRRIGRFGPPFGRRERLVPSREALATLLVQNSVALPAAMVARERALALGGLSEALWYTADWDFWLRLARCGPVAWLPERLASFRIHAASQTVLGSADLADFEAQLTAPLAAHGGALDGRDGERARRLGRAAILVNLWLASRLHERPLPVGPVARALAGLGPVGWVRFLRRSQILQRAAPRLGLLRRARGGG